MPKIPWIALLSIAACAVSISANAQKHLNIAADDLRAVQATPQPAPAAAPTSAPASSPASAPAASPASTPAVSTAPAPFAPASAPGNYAARPDALAFADDLTARRGLDAAWVRAALAQARYLPQLPKLVLPPPPGSAVKNWQVYRSRFVEPVRIRAGVRFWRRNAATLARAEREYGVPAQVIVGILGVETLYGQQMGTLRVLDTLSTLAFDFPAEHPRAAQRQAYFRGELEQFLSLCSHTDTDPTEPRGSYAGAMGMPQFMPSSWVRWAIDYDGDGRVDLSHSAADAIGSVANYLAGHGWTPGMPAYYALQFDPAHLQLDALLAPDILPSFSAAQMQTQGVLLDAAGQAHEGMLALIELKNGAAAPSYVAGTGNFYTLTRYNWSSYYAMAVLALGQAVAQAYGR